MSQHFGRFEMHNLLDGMRARVGSAGADDLNGLLVHLRQHGFKGALNGRSSGLFLPALKVRTVIRNV